MVGSGRISHIVICVRAENIDAAAKDFTAVLGLGSLEGPFDKPDQGLRVYIDWEAGIEIVAPVNDAATPLHAFLDEHGEGVLRVAFAVEDRDAALARVESAGHVVAARYDFLETFPEWRNRFEFARESALGELHGVRLNLCQIRETGG